MHRDKNGKNLGKLDSSITATLDLTALQQSGTVAFWYGPDAVE